jgi:glutamate--cysteine ligase catalytic subunit
MQCAQKRGAALNQKFWFRKDVTTGDSPSCCQTPTSGSPDDEYMLMSLSEIINGKVNELNIFSYEFTNFLAH